MSFRLVFTEEFRRSFDKVGDRKTMKRILRKVLELKENPKLGSMLVSLKDDTFGRLFRLRVGKFRVIYAVDRDESVIYVVTVGPRKTVYRNAGR